MVEFYPTLTDAARSVPTAPRPPTFDMQMDGEEFAEQLQWLYFLLLTGLKYKTPPPLPLFSS